MDTFIRYVVLACIMLLTVSIMLIGSAHLPVDFGAVVCGVVGILGGFAFGTVWFEIEHDDE